MFFGCGESPQFKHIKQRYIYTHDSNFTMTNEIIKQQYRIIEYNWLVMLDSIIFSDSEITLMYANLDNMLKKMKLLHETSSILLKMETNNDYLDFNWIKFIDVEKILLQEQTDYLKRINDTISYLDRRITSVPMNDTTFISFIADKYALFRLTYEEHLKSMNKTIKIRHRLINKMKFKSDLTSLTGAEIISKDLPQGKFKYQ